MMPEQGGNAVARNGRVQGGRETKIYFILRFPIKISVNFWTCSKPGSTVNTDPSLTDFSNKACKF